MFDSLSSFQQSPGPQTLHSLLSSWSFFAFFITWSCSLGDYFLVTLFFHWRFYHWFIYSQDVTSKCNLFLPLPAPLTFYQKFVLIFLGSVGCWTFPSRWLKAAQGHLIQYCISFFFYLSSYILFHLEMHNVLVSFLMLWWNTMIKATYKRDYFWVLKSMMVEQRHDGRNSWELISLLLLFILRQGLSI